MYDVVVITTCTPKQNMDIMVYYFTAQPDIGGAL